MDAPSPASEDIIVSCQENPSGIIPMAIALMNRGWGGAPNRINPHLHTVWSLVLGYEGLWKLDEIVSGTREQLLEVLRWQSGNFPQRLSLAQLPGEDAGFDVDPPDTEPDATAVILDDPRRSQGRARSE